VDTIEVGYGYSARYVVTLRDGSGRAVTGVYAGTETLGVVIGIGAGAELPGVLSTAEWAAVTRAADGRITSAVANASGGPAGTILLTIDEADIVACGVGTFGLTIELTDAGRVYECYRASLRVKCRPGGSGY
jgi:hypothetical protein